MGIINSSAKKTPDYFAILILCADAFRIIFLYEIMQAVILAAGKGTRMGTLTKDIPKPLLKVQGIPIIEWTLRNLPETITSIIIVVGYQADTIVQHIGPIYQGRPVVYVEQKIQNGTGGALVEVQDVLEERFIVLMGDDIYTRESIKQASLHPFSMTVYVTKDQQGLRPIKKTTDGYFDGFGSSEEGLQNQSVNTGLYSLTSAYFMYPQETTVDGLELSIPDTLLAMKDTITTVVLETPQWIHCNTPDDIVFTEQYLKKHKTLFI